MGRPLRAILYNYGIPEYLVQVFLLFWEIPEVYFGDFPFLKTNLLYFSTSYEYATIICAI